MSVLNERTREAWQAIANDLSKQRPYAGRRVRIVGGRKHKGKEGTVTRHQLDHYEDAFRYGGEASQHMAQMAGRDGYVVMVRPDAGKPFWVKARFVLCIDDAAKCDRCGTIHLDVCEAPDGTDHG